MKKFLILGACLAGFVFTGCGESEETRANIERQTGLMEKQAEADRRKEARRRQAIKDARGAEAGAAAPRPEGRAIPYADLYDWGLSGTPGSAERKYALLNALGLPPRLSKKELVEALNRLYRFEELDAFQAAFFASV